MANKVVSNTGPILHLIEINLDKAIAVFSVVLIPEEVSNELLKKRIIIPKKIKIVNLKPEFKDVVKVLTNQRDLDIGESQAIALALQERVDYFLTDDLDARTVAKDYNIEVHGTIGIILRAFRTKIIDKKRAIEKINELYTKSSLFITRDLIEKIIKSINEFK